MNNDIRNDCRYETYLVPTIISKLFFYRPLKYLAPYIFRVAISNQRIVSSAHGQVTFRYRDSQTGRWQTSTVSVEEFLRRFLQHVLPKGFVKVRYYGLFSPSLRHWLPVIRLWLQQATNPETRKDTAPHTAAAPRQVCRQCGHPMQWVRQIFPCSASPPGRPQQNASPVIDDFENKRLIKQYLRQLCRIVKAR